MAPSTVSKIAQRHGVSRILNYTRDELVDFVVRFLIGDEVSVEQREAIKPPPPGWWQASDGKWYPPSAVPEPPKVQRAHPPAVKTA